MNQLAKHRNIIITSSGICGIAPAETKKTDVLAMLRGFPTPMVLRKQENGHYIIVGPASISMRMDCTDVIRVLDEAKVENQKFTIA